MRHPSRRALDDARELIAKYFGPVTQRPFAVRYWNGEVDAPTASPAPLTLVLRHDGAARRMLAPATELRLGQAFVRGDFDIEGDLERAAELLPIIAGRVADMLRGWRSVPIVVRGLMTGLVDRREPGQRSSPRVTRTARAHSRARDAQAVRAHYDVGNDFYALWLDRDLVYSCAYFVTGSEDIDQAQRDKLDHICRKLRLAPGDRLLDIGCGWGALIRHAAIHYGVRATGITLSPAQAELARARIEQDGLSRVCTVRIEDYRDVAERVPFDKVVSVGMAEHVGAAKLAGYFAKVARLLRPGGLFLHHSIVRDYTREGSAVERWVRRHVFRAGAFIDRYIFPDGELTALAQHVGEAERAGFETCDVEALRTHYALTLRHWLRRLEAAAREAMPLVGEETFRAWRLYLAASAYAFAAGQQSVVQALFARPFADGRSPLPPTRRDLYDVPERAPSPIGDAETEI